MLVFMYCFNAKKSNFGHTGWGGHAAEGGSSPSGGEARMCCPDWAGGAGDVLRAPDFSWDTRKTGSGWEDVGDDHLRWKNGEAQYP